jgi:hypothetical protein
MSLEAVVASRQYEKIGFCFPAYLLSALAGAAAIVLLACITFWSELLPFGFADDLPVQTSDTSTLRSFGALVLLLASGWLIASVFAFVISATPFAVAIGLAGERIASSYAWSAAAGAVVGALAGMVLFLFVVGKEPYEISMSVFAFVSGVGMFGGVWAGLAYRFFSSRFQSHD